MLDDMTGTAAGKPRFIMPAGLPQVSHVPQPQVAGFDIDGALSNVMLNVWICHLVLRPYIFETKLIGRFRSSKERGRIMRNETHLPAVRKILPRLSNHVFIRNEGLLKLNDVACGASHADRVPPGTIYSHGWMGKVACQQEQCLRVAGFVPCAARPGSAHQQDGPMSASSAGCKSLFSAHHIAAVHFCGAGAEANLFY